MSEEIDLIENSMANTKIHFILNTALWESFDETIKSTLHSIPNWTEVKFLDENGGLSDSTKNLPNDIGGSGG